MKKYLIIFTLSFISFLGIIMTSSIESNAEVGVQFYPLDVYLEVPPNDPRDDDGEFSKNSFLEWVVHIGGGVQGHEENPKFKVTISDDAGVIDETVTVYPFDQTNRFGVSYRNLGDVTACVSVYSYQTGETERDCETITIVENDWGN
ncbi:hypothetical protein VQL36_16710 [Chengkuizengella sp. SCS-71B]|uniref:hypothetical protein n=1 Tax=Chengkuizengella sp. SCS-71B TaxID=3115290 RepID=UPI0032C214C2